jgi:LysM repeat protein
MIAVLLAAVVTAAAGGWTTIRVRPGDTLSAIAARHRATVAQLVAVNHLPGNGNLIYAGQTLRVPAPAAASSRPVWRTVDKIYLVRVGDSLFGLAARFHVDWRVIAKRNHLPRSLVVQLGQRLHIPQKVRVSAARRAPKSPGYPATTLRTAAHHRALLARRAVPSRTQVKALIRRTARAFGVDPALALALAYQESGFNQRVVSPADAIGAMQVLPSTGQFVSRYVVNRHLNLLDARDNIIAGVGLLSVLLRSARTPVAVAAYYQGLQSVRTRGMYADTRAYVRNVAALRVYFARQ